MKHPDVFDFDEHADSISFTKVVEDCSAFEKTSLLDKVNIALRDEGIIKGWRNEPFPVVTNFSSKPELLIERAACGYYGVKAYGVDVNGFVRDPSTKLISHIWIGKRAATKSTFPGMLDIIVAGGLPHGVSIMENVIKECMEEASIPESLAVTARPVGAVTNSYIDPEDNYKRDLCFCFDLELPADFTPVPQDGEVEGFKLLTVREVLDIVLEGGPTGFKTNCNIVLLDLLIRYFYA